MPQVLDEFVLEIGLDPKKFEEGRRALDYEVSKGLRTTEAFGKEVEQQGVKIAEVFGITKTGVAGIIATFMGAEAGAFVEHIRSMEAQTSRLADSIGVNRKELALWQNMVGLVGGKAADASQTIAGLNDALMSYRAGLSQPSAGFSQLMSQAGINYLNPNVTPTDVLRQITQFLSGLPEPDRRLRLQQVPGMTSQMMYLLLRGADDIAKFNEQLRGFSSRAVEAGDAAQNIDRSIGRINARLREFADAILTYLAPAINWVADTILGKFGPGVIGGVTGLGAGATTGGLIGGVIGSVVPGVGTLAGVGVGSALGAWLGAVGGIWGGYQLGVSSGSDTGGSGAASKAEVEAYIRKSAASQGINPDVAVAVAKAESGLNVGAVGDNTSSFGVFQLHKGGLADPYKQLTHHDASEMKFWQDQIDFSMAAARHTGWTPWHAWHGKQWEGISQPTGSQKTSSVTIGTINVTSNKADPKAVADQIPDAMRRYSMVSGINAGLT